MVAVEMNYLTMIEAMPPGTVLTFSDVSWDEYDELLHELNEQSYYRLTYDNGSLQVMSVSLEHERTAGFFPALILILADECDRDYLSVKSATLKKKRAGVGTEPDDCFYFREFKKIRAKKRLDLSVDPPPDLAIEVDITSGSIRKFPIYASLGVPELWRYRNGKLKFYRLARDDYDESTHSELFPFLTPAVVMKYLRKGEEAGIVTMTREFRKWVQANKS